MEKPDSGQAIIEYILTLSIAMAVIVILSAGIRRPMSRVWSTLAREIAAACPTCPKEARIRF